MEKSSSRKIDIYNHILPEKYKEALFKKARGFPVSAAKANPALFDLDIRFRVMDRHEGLAQVLTMAIPAVEQVADPEEAVGLARKGNDEMAELVSKYPDRFLGAVASLPMNNMDAALRETDRAVGELHFKGVQVYTSINGKPLDSPEFMDLYAKMEEYDLPIWIHPTRGRNTPEYPGEEMSKYRMFATFGWPFETTIAMSRLAISGVLEKYPNVKFITHHLGGMIPFFEQRLAMTRIYDYNEEDIEHRIPKPPLEYLKKFYGDTVVSGSVPALMCGLAFFGSDHMLFGSDYPYGEEKSAQKLENTIASVNAMDISPSDKAKIFEKNAVEILHLSG